MMRGLVLLLLTISEFTRSGFFNKNFLYNYFWLKKIEKYFDSQKLNNLAKNKKVLDSKSKKYQFLAKIKTFFVGVCQIY